MASFFSRLESRARRINSLLCVGLDPHPQDLPAHTGQAAYDFCLRIIESTADLALAYKPNAAFFEVLGPAGWSALRDVIDAIPEDIPVLLDAKRGDIASTARAYAQSVFETLRADAVTINPYLGQDSIAPFTENPEKGVFLLCKTSNPGAAELQDLPLGTYGFTKLYQYVAHLAHAWNKNDNIGLVVGATQVHALARIRDAEYNFWLLTPGVGPQGGDLEAALQAGLREDGLGMLIPASRGISRASDPRKAALELRDAINATRENIYDQTDTSPDLPIAARYHQLADGLLHLGCVQFGEFTLKSGMQSPIYIDLRRLVVNPRLLALVGESYLPILHKLNFDHLAAIPYAALPIATTISLLGGWSLIYPRKEVKSYGTKAQIEGIFSPGDSVVVIDDLITTGGSKLEAIETLTSAGLVVSDIVVLINRQSGGGDLIAAQGLNLHAVFTLPQLLDYWEFSGQIDAVQAELVRQFLTKG